MERALRVLITNNTLAARAGSELYVRDLALALLRRGHFPMAFSTSLGEVAEELRQATVPVVDDLDAINVEPDIIHAQHHLDAMAALLRFPRVPAVYVCHGWAPWEERPPLFPTIQRYVAVDELCQERLFSTKDIRPDSVEVLLNFVDTRRFVRRGPLPPKPRTALVFSNNLQDSGALDAIRKACKRQGIGRLDFLGAATGNATAPEAILGGYDVVFAKARAALEAMASGCAVIVLDAAGLGGMVTTRNMTRLRSLNFGVRTMQAHTISEEAICRELQTYDPSDAAAVCDWIRKDADMDLAVDRWLEIYRGVMARWGERLALDTSGEALAQEELRAASEYLGGLARFIKTRGGLRDEAPAAGPRPCILPRPVHSRLSRFFRKYFG